MSDLEKRYKVIDTHTHYAHQRFDYKRDEVLESLESAGVCAVIEGAIDFESNRKMYELCQRYRYVYMAIGCHPNCIKELDAKKFEEIKEYATLPKVIAIGETGLDYSGYKIPEQVILQKEWFGEFIKLATYSEKPLVIHCREAYDDLIKILVKHNLSKRAGIIHCFSGTLEQAEKLIDMGFYLGIGGLFTKPDNWELKQAIKKISLSNIVLETDAPYLLPVGASGKRNTSLNLKCVVKELADLHCVSKSVIYGKALENTLDLFPELVSVLC